MLPAAHGAGVENAFDLDESLSDMLPGAWGFGLEPIACLSRLSVCMEGGSLEIESEGHATLTRDHG